MKRHLFLIFPLLLRIFSASCAIFRIRLSGKDNLLLHLASCPVRPAVRPGDRETVVRLTQFYLSLRRRLGMRDTCLTNSLLLCRVLRQSGIDARVNFGVMKDPAASGGMNTAGHCWVTVAGEETHQPYPLLFTYP